MSTSASLIRCAGLGLSLALCVLPVSAQATAPVSQLSSETQQVIARDLVAQALAFEHGEGVSRDPARAAALYCEAARFGDPEAMYSLGWMYGNGRGVERNESFAATLIDRAADLGHEGAQSARRFFSNPSGEQPECIKPQQPALAAVPTPAASAPQANSVDLTEADLANIEGYVATLPAAKQRIAELVQALARQYGVHPKLALAIAVTESNLDILARSPKGAQGIMQLMPETAARFGVAKVYDPGKNIRGGLSYLRWLLSYYRGDVLLAAAAYNAGEGAVDRNRGIPPFMETVNYVKRVLAIFRQSEHPFDATLVGPSPIVAGRSKILTR